MDDDDFISIDGRADDVIVRGEYEVATTTTPSPCDRRSSARAPRDVPALPTTEIVCAALPSGGGSRSRS
jgi:hypothetical protein